MMKKHYISPVISLYILPAERLLGEYTQNTNNAPEAPNGTVAGAKESDFDDDDEEE